MKILIGGPSIMLLWETLQNVPNTWKKVLIKWLWVILWKHWQVVWTHTAFQELDPVSRLDARPHGIQDSIFRSGKTFFHGDWIRARFSYSHKDVH